MLSPILSVADIDASIDYYTTKLGFSLNWRLADDQDRATFASVSLGEAEILLGTIDFVAADQRDKLGIGVQFHLELPVEMDIDELYVAAWDAGANIVREIETREWGERAFVVNDLDGYNYMIARPLSEQPSGS